MLTYMFSRPMQVRTTLCCQACLLVAFCCGSIFNPCPFCITKLVVVHRGRELILNSSRN